MRFAAPLCCVALAATACTTVGPDYRAPEAAALSVPEAYYGPRPRLAGQAPADLGRWWEYFDDPLLTRLIERGERRQSRPGAWRRHA